MVTIAGKLAAQLTMDNTGFKAGIKESEQVAQSFGRKYKSFLKDLKSSFGRSSTLGQSLKIAAGGGAIVGLTAIAHQLSDMAQKVGEVRKQYHEGKADVGDFVEAFARGAPIVGAFFSAGRDIREAFTGEQAAIQEDIDREKELVALAKERSDTIKSIGKQRKEQAKIEQEYADRSALLFKTGDAKRFAEIELENKKRERVYLDRGANVLTDSERKDRNGHFAAINKLNANKPIVESIEAITARERANNPGDPHGASAAYAYTEEQIAERVHRVHEKQLADLAVYNKAMRDQLEPIEEQNKKIQEAIVGVGRESILSDQEELRQKIAFVKEGWDDTWKGISDSVHESAEKSKASIKDLKSSISTIGMNKYDRELGELTKDNPASNVVREFERLLNLKKQFERSDYFRKEAKQTLASSRTPAEQYQAKLNDLNEQKKNGLSDNAYSRAVGDAGLEFRKSLDPGETRRAGLEERRETFATPQDDRVKNPLDGILKISDSTLKAIERQTQLMLQQNALLKTNQLVTVEIGPNID